MKTLMHIMGIILTLSIALNVSQYLVWCDERQQKCVHLEDKLKRKIREATIFQGYSRSAMRTVCGTMTAYQTQYGEIEGRFWSLEAKRQCDIFPWHDEYGDYAIDYESLSDFTVRCTKGDYTVGWLDKTGECREYYMLAYHYDDRDEAVKAIQRRKP